MTIPAIANLVHETTTGTGTGNLTLTPYSQSFNQAFGNGATPDVFYYFIQHRTAAEWEYGTGHMSDATTLVRDTAVESSNANAAVNFSAGTKDVCNDLPARAVIQVQSTDTGLSRTAAKTVAVGDGTQGDASGTLLAGSLSLTNAVGFAGGAGVDTGLSRPSVGVVAVGNGTPGDGSGTLLANSVSATNNVCVATPALNSLFNVGNVVNIATNPLNTYGQAIFSYGDHAFSSLTSVVKTRGVDPTNHTILQDADQIFAIDFGGSDGSAYSWAGTIQAYVDGTPGANSIPARLEFWLNPVGGTQAAANRFTIGSEGTVRIPTAIDAGSLPGGVLGQIAVVSNADSGLAWGATITNAGSANTSYIAWYNGSNWTVMGK